VVYIKYFWQENHQIYSGYLRCLGEYGSGQTY